MFYEEIKRQLKQHQQITARLQAMRKNPVRNRKRIAQLQAMEEGQRDVLSTTITQAQSAASAVDKNNYRTYGAQVQAAYEMYHAKREYGAELMQGIIDIASSFICGSGLSVSADKPQTKKYIDKFLATNKLHGSNLMRLIRIGKLEGKCLAILNSGEDVFYGPYVKVTPFSWWNDKYTVYRDGEDIVKIVYKDKETHQEKSIPVDRSVYVKLGGSEMDWNDTPNKIHCVLTDIENASRAKYDLRKNAHLFGKVIPNFKTENLVEAKALNAAIQSGAWEIGTGYAGTANLSLAEPSGSAADVLIKDMLNSLRYISTMTGIPIYWMSWPELMSNRATAESYLETIAASSRNERLIWQEAFEEIIYKSMVYAVNRLAEDNSVIGPFKVSLPMISTTKIKELSETWLPLQMGDVISMATLRNKIPEVDPIYEEKQIDKERQEKAQDSPDLNATIEKQLAEIRMEEEDA